ncbi:tripartite motif containing 108 [Embiotoca jacksoni]|uniref:tripartite motif containing 108 n=1 Tax=Embiotoca jacksoni TaxID=100190 RepID=UPI003704C00F
MASFLCSEDLTCCICLNFFSDPVTLLCGHSFCRQCITDVLSTHSQCPQCRTPVSTEAESLPTVLTLKSLAEKAKEAEKMKKERGDQKSKVDELCPEHEEKLKLFCITDQQLACIICRDGERHEGHKFKPIKEAAADVRKKLETFVQQVSGDINAIESLENSQRKEIMKTKDKSEQLKKQIHQQFEELHQFLKKREGEIKNELKHKELDGVEKMRKSLNAIETALSESRELEGEVTSVLKITDSERFLKSWTERNKTVTPKLLFNPRSKQLQVVNTSLSLGPYESHLQFFVWKEMLQVIQPRAELLTLKSNSASLAVSEDGRSLIGCPKITPVTPFVDQYGYGSQCWQVQSAIAASSSSTNHAFSASEFSSGQHYWEVEVGTRDFWEIGIKCNFLKYDGKKYSTCGPNVSKELAFTDRPRKIGIYVDCSSKKLSFYHADTMTHVPTMSYDLTSLPVSAYFNIRYSDTQPDRNPVTVCWY